jgi:hypothetical protein
MKNSFMMMVGAAAGIGLYVGLNNMSKNKKQIKQKMNDFIDDTAEMFN